MKLITYFMFCNTIYVFGTNFLIHFISALLGAQWLWIQYTKLSRWCTQHYSVPLERLSRDCRSRRGNYEITVLRSGKHLAPAGIYRTQPRTGPTPTVLDCRRSGTGIRSSSFCHTYATAIFFSFCTKGVPVQFFRSESLSCLHNGHVVVFSLQTLFILILRTPQWHFLRKINNL